MTIWREWAAGLGGDLGRLVPERLAESDATPTAADRQGAWRLYGEIRSRITTQPLHYRSGDEGTALASVYQLFPNTREIVKEQGPEGAGFADVAWAVLNGPVRPFTARWHKRFEEGAFASEDDRHTFRTQLDGLRPVLLQFEEALRALALNEVPQPIAAPPATSPHALRWPSWQAADIRDLDSVVVTREQAAVAARRRAVAGDENQGATTELAPPVGLALSGGGIRSAAFCLGVVQVLAKRGLLRDVDYLSTVSGGSYTGGFLTSLFQRLGGHDDVAAALESESREVRALRQRTRHHLLGGRGPWALVELSGVLASGLVVSLSAVVLILAAVLLIRWLAAILHVDQVLERGFWPIALVVMTVLLVGTTLLRRTARAGPGARRPKWVARATALGLVITGTAGLLEILELAFPAASGLPELFPESLATGLTLPVIAAALARLAKRTRAAALILEGVVLLVVPAALAVAYRMSVDWFVLGVPTTTSIVILGGGVVLATLCFVFSDVNATSAHAWYRDRLAWTFLGPPDGTARAAPRLSELTDPRGGAPYPIVNGTVNLPRSSIPELCGRKSDFFVFTPHTVGSRSTGYVLTVDVEQADPTLDLAAAIAISGAAASSHMGTLSARSRVPLLTLLNIRLGYWLPNLGRRDGPADRAKPARPGKPTAVHLLRELTSQLDETLDFLNVSDGGHIENLGLYELLRRRCRLIIVVDAEADADVTCAALIKCMRYARFDLGVVIDIDLADFTRDAEGRTRAHFQLGTIDYGGGRRGHLVFVKSSVTGDEGPEVREYRTRHPAFPHESTADQFYGEEQFEAYRALGEHIARTMFRPELAGRETGRLTADGWLAHLCDRLLPDDDPRRA